MHAEEVFRWIEHHSKSLSSFRAWLNTQDIDHIAPLWEKPLTNVSYEDACEITQRIVSGEIERPFPDETAACVRREAAKLRDHRQYHAQEEIRTNRGIECGLCHGTGMVTIWHMLIVKCVRDGIDVFRHPKTHEMYHARTKDGELKRDTLACACKCKLGDRFANASKNRRGQQEQFLPRFGDSNLHAAVGLRDTELSHEDRVAADVEQWCPRVVEWAIDGGGFDDNGGFE